MIFIDTNFLCKFKKMVYFDRSELDSSDGIIKIQNFYKVSIPLYKVSIIKAYKSSFLLIFIVKGIIFFIV